MRKVNRVRVHGFRLFNLGGREITKSRIIFPVLIVVIILLLLVLVIIPRISNVDNIDDNQKYSLNISYGLGGDTDQTKLTFDANISGAESDMKNIDAYEILINEEYLDLLIENGPYSSKDMGTYLQITGSIVFDNLGMTKEEIDAINLFEGIKIIDKDGTEFDLHIPQDQKTNN